MVLEMCFGITVDYILDRTNCLARNMRILRNYSFLLSSKNAYTTGGKKK